MVEGKYCPTCGREIKEEARTRREIIDSINSMLGVNAWDLNGKQSHLLEIEKAIKNLLCKKDELSVPEKVAQNDIEHEIKKELHKGFDEVNEGIKEMEEHLSQEGV